MNVVEIIEVSFAGLIGVIEAIGAILLGKWAAKLYVQKQELKKDKDEDDN